MDKCEDAKATKCEEKLAVNQKLQDDAASPKFGPRSREAATDAGRPVLPPYILEELSKRNPTDKSFDNTLQITQQLQQDQGGFQPHAVEQHTGGKREVYDAKGKEVHPGDKVRFEGEAATGNADADLVYDYTGKVRDFYKNVFGKDSIDGQGMKMISTVNYGENFQNAFWNGKQMTYGHPSDKSPFKSFVLLDVTGHEITHGVTQNTSGTFYWGQAGALNEHLSDVMGELVQQYSLNQTADKADWVVGDGIWKDNIKGRGIRDMLHPGTAFDDPKIGKDPQPAHMKDYVRTWKDMGGVHYNSGIPNRAFATFAQNVGGNAWDKPGHIWYEASQHMGVLPSFASFAEETLKAAKKLGYTDEIPKLKAAWQEVGVLPAGKAKDTLTPRVPKDQQQDKEQDPKGPIPLKRAG